MMKRRTKIVLRIVLFGLLGCIVCIPAMIFVYNNIDFNTGKLSSELGFVVEPFEEEKPIIYRPDREIDFEFTWSDTYRISETYGIHHFKNENNMHADHLNRMVRDRLYRVRQEDGVAEVVYESRGSQRILYACDEYLVLYDANKNACLWMDYQAGTVIDQCEMGLSLSGHRYSCTYNSETKTLCFEEYKNHLFISEWVEIRTFQLEDTET